jgi:tRNA-specific 2-thiouridylase
MTKKVMVAMSGGVDSSVAAYLLIQQGFDVAGMTLKLFERDISESNGNDITDAERVAESLGIKYYIQDLSSEFKTCVMDRFAESYRRGDTPNPCIFCNKTIKFGRMLEIASGMGYDHIATGHYARSCYDETLHRWVIKKALNLSKDQSYVLYTLSQEQISKTLFPLGDMTKAEVRDIAKTLGFDVADKPESQDICFIPDGDYKAFIERSYGIEANEGNFVDVNGRVLGRHRGIIGYTTGQRRGLGVSAEKPLYVLWKDMERNEVVLGGSDALFKRRLTVREANLLSVERLLSPMEVSAKIRYSQTSAEAVISPLNDSRIQVDFCKPQRAPTRGQSAVFYQGDIVVGGGIIE